MKYYKNQLMLTVPGLCNDRSSQIWPILFVFSQKKEQEEKLRSRQSPTHFGIQSVVSAQSAATRLHAPPIANAKICTTLAVAVAAGCWLPQNTSGHVATTKNLFPFPFKGGGV